MRMLLSGTINLNRCSCGKGEVIVRNFPDTESEKLTELEFSLKIYKEKKKADDNERNVDVKLLRVPAK